MTPWDHHPDLSRDRLITIGQLIASGRNNALDRYDPSIGCTPWNVGCDAFSFQKHEIEQAASDFEWLSIIDPSMQFVFSIGQVPVRFYRGEPDEPTTRTLKQSFHELRQGSLFGVGELEEASIAPIYRFAIETDTDGSLMAITFVILSGDAPVLTWMVPLDEAVSKLSPLWLPASEGVELPAPSIGVARRKAKDGTTE